MSDRFSRRDFLKVAGVGAVATAVLTGCGPDSRYIKRQPYYKMPEYTYNGLSTEYATTCMECPAGCGLVVRTMQGRALKVEGNPNNPINQGKTCSRAQASLQGLYNPDRIQKPLKQSRGGAGQEITWEEAVSVVEQAMSTPRPSEIAFVLGMASDHLADLITEITAAMGAPAPYRYGAFAMFESRSTLAKAAGQVLGSESIPFFDIGGSDAVFSFGANFLETYISPVAFGRGYSELRKGKSTGKRGILVQFEPRLSQTAAAADYWIPILPGSEGLAALGIGRAAAELIGGTLPALYQNIDLAKIAQATGVSAEIYRTMAGLFKSAAHPLAIPGSGALAAANGLEAAAAVLALNLLAGNAGKPGGVFNAPSFPIKQAAAPMPNLSTDIQGLIQAMNDGSIKTLFIHGVNPFYEFPPSWGFTEAAKKVSTIISFSSFPDETSQQADYVLPDHTAMESWGYQRDPGGSDRPVISGAQPVVMPLYNTKSTADVLLAAIHATEGKIAQEVPYKDVVEFIQHSIQDLLPQKGFFNAPDLPTFWTFWQQFGGWWGVLPGLVAPEAAVNLSISTAAAQFDGDGDYYLFPFLSPILSDGSGANRPWLQETPDPVTTVMWGTWVEINPSTADKLGIEDDDIVRLTSPYGEIEVPVYRYPAIRPDTIAVPFGQGHTAYGRFAKDRGVNLANLLGKKGNSTGDLAVTTLKIKISRTGKKQTLARMEGKLGVYGNFKPSGE
jgi:anaerobic selenocysteine-containing dehydrogenase